MVDFANNKNTRQRVADLLRAKDELQVNDFKLLANFWYHELKQLNKPIKEITALELLQLVAKGHLTPTESIRRNRQLLQEKNPTLYGTHNRKEEKRESVRQQVISFQ